MTNTTAPVYGSAYKGTAPENYERYFVPVIGRPFAEDLVANAALQPGERVLDVACGTGVVARLAAERVGESGTVAALDLNPAMLAVARATAGASGARIRWYETSAESMPLPDEGFDAVLCQVALQFMNDKPAALREMRRMLAPGGRVLVSTPTPTPFFEVMEQAIARHIGAEPAGFVRMVFSLDDPNELERLMREAGFHDVAARTDTKVLRLPAAKDFLWQYIHCTPMTALLSQVDPSRLAALENEVVRGWQPWSKDGAMESEQGVIIATARK